MSERATKYCPRVMTVSCKAVFKFDESHWRTVVNGDGNLKVQKVMGIVARNILDILEAKKSTFRGESSGVD